MANPEPQKRCVFGEYCRKHGFVHGAEAEELRKRLEMLVADVRSGERGIRRLDICCILDGVDARDSLAYIAGKTLASSPQKEQAK